jgi:hypothetical protein
VRANALARDFGHLGGQRHCSKERGKRKKR